ncbi:MAG: YqjF family protein [Caldilineaceae bacterium]
MLVELTDHVSHRPYPLPNGPWFMHQSWLDLLFAHWPVSAQELRPHIPDDLEIDTYNGTAWFSLVMFRMSGVRPRRLPSIPGLSSFPEVNLRTYVFPRNAGVRQPGVWFFSLDAHNRAAVAVARRVYHLPYFHADMSLTDTQLSILYKSERTHKHAPPATLSAEYYPVDGIEYTLPGTLDHWVSERYCLYTTDRQGRLLQAQVHHLPWPLQKADCQFHTNTMIEAAGLPLPVAAPLLHFARRLDVLIWPMHRVEQ